MTEARPRPKVAEWIQHHAELKPEPWQVRAVERIASGEFDARSMWLRPRGLNGGEHAAAWNEFLRALRTVATDGLPLAIAEIAALRPQQPSARTPMIEADEDWP